MKLSTKGRYGLRAAVDLAIFAKSEPISISTIAAREGLSESYLEQLFAKLKKAGLVSSSRGQTVVINWRNRPAIYPSGMS